ncbi:MAG: hypothetical protein IID37_10985 [Planctomycetes bacterium]|nr:hypothetical protein [Planctomycetota bacterium]
MHSRHLVLVLALAGTAHGQVFSYECDSFPEDSGWEVVSQFCDPETWLDGGWYFQHVEPGCGGPPGGGQDEYTRDIGEFADESTFFVEWVVETDGSNSEIDGVAPAALAAGGFAGILYHFTISADQVRFLRDASFPIVWVDIQPDVPHTYRLELYGAELYIWFIDGQVIDSGRPEGAYPNLFSLISWRGKSWYLESTTQWDYIRYGTIPKPGSGDFDSDDDVDLDDYYFFHDCVTGPNTNAGPGCVWADFDGDSDVDLIDFGHFQANFTGSAD